MRKFYLAYVTAILATAFSASCVFAGQDMSSSDSKSCANIVKACLDAGYTNEDTGDKKFWQNCMKPIVLGQAVQGVTIDANTTKTCRTDKIAQMKKELAEFLKAGSKK